MLSHLFLAALIASFISAVPFKTDRKCIPVQHEMAVLGKVAQDNKGQAQVSEFIGRFAADYKAKKEVIIESVFSEGKFVGNYTYLRTSVSIPEYLKFHIYYILWRCPFIDQC